MPSRSKAQWQRETLSPFLQGNPERKASFATASALEEGPLATPEEVQSLDYHRDLGYPGEYPFTRG
ncbi:MAG: methylmalonyl-CoA mutase, partial [Chloroflexi bacterium]|nr:methylmalonyl-CoA mutase [Chloroflexota bacterium]